MEQFYTDREEDFAKWLELNQILIEKDLLTAKEIFEHAYTLGALSTYKKREQN